MNPEQNFIPTEEQARSMREAMRPAPPPKIDPEAMRNTAPGLLVKNRRRTRLEGDQDVNLRPASSHRAGGQAVTIIGARTQWKST